MVTPPVTRWSSSPFSFFGFFFFTWDVDMLLLNMMYVSGYMNRHKMNIYWNIYWNDMALIYTTFSYCSQCLTWCNLFVTTNHMGPRREYLAKGAFTQMVTQILWGECSYLQFNVWGDPEKLCNLSTVMQPMSSENRVSTKIWPPKSASYSLLLTGKEDRLEKPEWGLSGKQTEVLKAE